MTAQSESANKANANSDNVFGGRHWATPGFFNNTPLVDWLIKHTLAQMRYGRTDLGEVLEVVGQLKGSDEDIWISAWSAMAQRLQDRAEEADRNGKLVSASTAYLRASTYWRTSQLYFNKSEDPRVREYSLASVKCYERYLELSDYPGKHIEIPYEGQHLPGYFYRSPVAADNAPLLIVTPGRDSWAEDFIWASDAAIRRGIHCIAFDGPGQGLALRLNGLTFRQDWENVVGPVIDYALEKIPGIDPSRIALMGMSMGGYLTPRAAAYDKRIKLLIPNPGTHSWGATVIERLTPYIDSQPDEIPEAIHALLRDYAWKQGVPGTVKDVIENMKIFDNSDHVEKITCETLVTDGTGEVYHGAKPFYDALKCTKTYMLFDESTTAQMHVQVGGYATASEMMFDWIADRL